MAQEPAAKPKKTDWSKVDLGRRSADHFMLQVGYTSWTGTPDSIKTKGFSRTFNMYLLFDFPFKTNPRLSVAIGPGVGTDNIFFEKTYIDIKNKKEAQFRADTVNKYKKYKLALGYLELPVEFRYSANPANMNKSFKFAIGAKVGTTMDVHTKAKVELDQSGDAGYTYKVKDKKFFNGTRIAGTARVGYGNISLFGTYTLTELFKSGSGPQGIRPFTVGLCFSGL